MTNPESEDGTGESRRGRTGHDYRLGVGLRKGPVAGVNGVKCRRNPEQRWYHGYSIVLRQGRFFIFKGGNP